MAELHWFAFIDYLKGGEGLMLLFLAIGIHAYLTFSLNHLSILFIYISHLFYTYIYKAVCL